MKSRAGYQQRLFKSALGTNLTVIEKVTIVALLLMLGISSWESLQGRDIGSVEQLKLAKLKAQELISYRGDQRPE